VGFHQQPMNEWNPSEVQKKPELPEVYFDTPNFGLQSLVAAAKRSDAHLRSDIGRKEARADAALQEKAVRSKKRVFLTEARLYRCTQCGRQGQDIHEIRNSENGIQLKVAATEALAILQAAPQAQGRCGV